jgi:hypothetical protein
MALKVLRGERFQLLANSVPLATGEEIEIRAAVPPGIFASLFVLGSEGRLRKLAEISGDAPQRELCYPPNGKSIELVGAPGTELFFVCGSRTGCPSESDVRPLAGAAKPLPALLPLTVLRLRPDTVEVAQESRDVSEPKDTPRARQRDAVSQIDRFRLRLGERYEYIDGLAFAHVE